MANFDADERRLTIKLVYYGPALSGKTTNLMRLHDRLRPELKGEIMLLDTQNDRTLFFDLLPLGFRTPSGLVVKFKLFTVPGQVAHDSTRKAVLSRADGVVFVADSQLSQNMNNAESFAQLEANAARVGLDFERLPLVVQFNKRDLPHIQSEEEILACWREAPWPVTFSVALTGIGVVETFTRLIAGVYSAMDERYGLNREHGLTRDSFIAQTVGEAAAASVPRHDGLAGQAGIAARQS